MYLIPDYINEISRSLRKNQTIAEKIIWNKIKNKQLGVKFLRQKPIYIFTEINGAFRFAIPDFYCYEEKLIIEIDGKIHNIPQILELDKIKEEFIKRKGFKIIRIKNDDIYFDVNKVISNIKNNLTIFPSLI